MPEPATWRLSIRTLLLASALSGLANTALAQYGSPGGYLPYTFDAPAAAASAPNADINEDTQPQCNVQSRGRGGQQYQCNEQSPPQPKR
jgi:hypothetical protein